MYHKIIFICHLHKGCVWGLPGAVQHFTGDAHFSSIAPLAELWRASFARNGWHASKSLILLRGWRAALSKLNRCSWKRYHFSWITLCAGTYADCLSSLVNLCVGFRKLPAPVSNQFTCTGMWLGGHGNGPTWGLEALADTELLLLKCLC